MEEKLEITPLQMKEVHGRLSNWGRWLRHDIRGVRGYPTRAPFVFSPSNGGMIAELDAVEIEYIVSSLGYLRIFQPDGELYAFVLRVFYGQRSITETPPVEVLADDVNRRFKRSCGKSTFYRHLRAAKVAVYHWAPDLE